jgi:predicted GNAT family N-acyltransferase
VLGHCHAVGAVALIAEHGTGAGAALLDAVVGPEDSAALWVADPNPRAQAFYRKHGLVADGTVQVEDGVRELRMVRFSAAGAPQPDPAAQPSTHGEDTL